MEFYRKLSNAVKKKLYYEETGYYLNYLTLSISEPKIAREARLYSGQ